MDEKTKVVVTGIGILAANGLNKSEVIESLQNNRSGLAETALLKKLNTKTHIAGSLPKDFKELNELGEEKTVLLAYEAIDEALYDSGMTKEDINKMEQRAGLSFSTSMGGYLHTLDYVKKEKNKEELSPDTLINMPLSASAIARYIKLECGCVYTTMSACAAGTAAIGLAYDQIKDGKADLMVVVGADPLTEISASGFNILNSMSIKGCRPFDKERDGMNIGEGASAVIIESLEHALQRDAQIYAEIIGYGLGNDAYHITSPEPSGICASNTMLMAFHEAEGIKLGDIDYINAHGTGTVLNDRMELNAISKFYGEDESQYKVAVSSTKSFTGHCLGAAGSIEFAMLLLAIKHNFIPPTYDLDLPSEEFEKYNLIKTCQTRHKVRVAMSNSFAFAGNSASILVKAYENESI